MNKNGDVTLTLHHPPYRAFGATGLLKIFFRGARRFAPGTPEKNTIKNAPQGRRTWLVSRVCRQNPYFATVPS